MIPLPVKSISAVSVIFFNPGLPVLKSEAVIPSTPPKFPLVFQAIESRAKEFSEPTVITLPDIDTLVPDPYCTLWFSSMLIKSEASFDCSDPLVPDLE